MWQATPWLVTWKWCWQKCTIRHCSWIDNINQTWNIWHRSRNAWSCSWRILYHDNWRKRIYLRLTPGHGQFTLHRWRNSPKGLYWANGDIVTVGDVTAFGQISDINRKENIVRISNALDKIKQVSGYTYNYIDNPTPMKGVVAQELENILPEVVYNTVLLDGTVSKAVRHGNIVGLLIEAIKE